MLLVTEGGKIVGSNPAVEQLLGWTADELRNRRLTDVLAGATATDHRERLDRIVQRALDGHLAHAREQGLARSGHRLDIELRFALLHAAPKRLVVTIVGWTRAHDESSAYCFADLTYEISLMPFGTITRARGTIVDGVPDGGIGRPCFEVLNDRTAPCLRCPAMHLQGTEKTLGVVRYRNAAAPAIVFALRSGARSARLSAFCVERHVLGELIGVHFDIVAEHVGLTAREREILALAMTGALTSEIASRLKISPSTAKFHMTNILDKLGIESRAELLRRLF